MQLYKEEIKKKHLATLQLETVRSQNDPPTYNTFKLPIYATGWNCREVESDIELMFANQQTDPDGVTKIEICPAEFNFFTNGQWIYSGCFLKTLI